MKTLIINREEYLRLKESYNTMDETVQHIKYKDRIISKDCLKYLLTFLKGLYK